MATGVPRKLSSEQAIAHLAAIVESSDDAIISKTPDGTILTWNGGAERVYGYAEDDAIGRPMTMLLPDDRPDEENEILRRIRAGERVEHFETVRRRKDGSLIDVSLSISPILDADGTIVGASHVARDISERKHLDEQAHRLAAIVEYSEDAIISKTLEGKILTWNTGAENVYGYPANEVIGRPMTLLLPEDRPDEEAKILARIGKGERVEHFETVRRRKDGTRLHVSLTISPIRDRNGRIIGASHVARDVTERKLLDEQLRHTQKLESLGVLAGGLAHDFNNLLTGILGNTSLAIEMLSNNNPVRAALKDVLKASERASLLTRQLLAYAGKGPFLIESINISDLVREISALIQSSVPKNVLLRLELRDDLPLVQADPSRIQQLIMNLVINGAEAINASENGTVLVTTGVQQVDSEYLLTTLGKSDLELGTYVSLEVRDTGCGMDEATMAKMFDPFFTTKFTGRGLGLSAVQGIVSGHKGAMKVYSRPGRGTTFKILLPATDQRPQPNPVESLEYRSNDELILVIDDEDVIRRTAKSILERHGYKVVVAQNGKEGVELFEVLGGKVSAVILDMTMPVMGGEESLRRLQLIDPHVRVILSSGYNEVEAVRHFSGKELSGFIQKPYAVKNLLEKVNSVVQHDHSINS